MALQRSLGDRRQHGRLDVTGELWASLSPTEPVVLRNIARGGALIEASIIPGLTPNRSARIRLGEEGPDVTMLVRRCLPFDALATGRCLIALEFVELSPADQARLDQFIQERERRGTPA